MKINKKKRSPIMQLICNIKHNYESRKNWEMKMNVPIHFTITSEPRTNK